MMDTSILRRKILPTSQQGATLVEYSLVVTFLFALLGGTMDFGLGFYRYNLLSHTTNKVVRELSASIVPQSGEPCDELEEDIEKRAIEVYNDVLGMKGTWYDFDATVTSGDSTVVPPVLGEITLRGEMELECFFCQFFPKGVHLTTSSFAAVEHDNFECI